MSDISDDELDEAVTLLAMLGGSSRGSARIPEPPDSGEDTYSDDEFEPESDNESDDKLETKSSEPPKNLETKSSEPDGKSLSGFDVVESAKPPDSLPPAYSTVRIGGAPVRIPIAPLDTPDNREAALRTKAYSSYKDYVETLKQKLQTEYTKQISQLRNRGDAVVLLYSLRAQEGKTYKAMRGELSRLNKPLSIKIAGDEQKQDIRALVVELERKIKAKV